MGAQKAQEDERERQRQEEMRKKTEEEQKRIIEAKASLTMLFSLQNLASALPENFDKLKANFERTTHLELSRTGARRETLAAEAAKTLRHATKYVQQVRDQRARFEAWQSNQKTQESAQKAAA